MTKKVYINYADDAFKVQQDFALRKAKKEGGFNKIIGYTRDAIDEEFYKQNKHILNQKRGGGYWLWKPYFIYKTLEDLNEGDYLFYSDSGAFFLKNIDILISELEKYNQDIMGFELPLIEKQWTKKELFINMDCHANEYTDSNQIQASFQLIKKSDFSINFYKTYLTLSTNEINITDKFDANITQDVSFMDHRHDQSIFSLLYKKNNLKPFKDPTQYGKYPFKYSGTNKIDFTNNKIYNLDNGRKIRIFNYDSNYDMILLHNRKGNPLNSFIKYKIGNFFPFLYNIYNYFKEKSTYVGFSIDLPLVSIVTVVFNGEKYLEDTIKSVLSQTYKNIEYIIIDGGSADNSIDIIKRYEDKISYWISEKDKNMYDGINKGLKIATGDIVASLNSDDYYADENAISDVVTFISNYKCDGIYGNVVKYYQENGTEIEKKLFQIDFKKLLLSRHSTFMPQPTLFIKKEIYKKLNYFDLAYNYASDFDFNLKCIKNYNIRYFDRRITFFRQHNETITSSGKLDNERKDILIQHGINSYSKFIKYIYYYFYWTKYKVKNLL
jgi:hypothetical protein